MGGQGGYSNALFELMLDLGAKMGQDSPKSPPRGPQEPSKSCPRASKSPPRGPWGQIFGGFLIDVLLSFYRFNSSPGMVAKMARKATGYIYIYISGTVPLHEGCALR